MPQKKKATVEEVKNKVAAELEKARKAAEKEVVKVRKQMETAAKKVDEYVKKNPKEAAAIAAGIGVALGAAVAMLLRGKKK